MYTPEHHPYCPAFHSFDIGLNKDDVECCCIECRNCHGSGIIEINEFYAGDQQCIETADCMSCEGSGRRILKPELLRRRGK